MRLLPWVMMCVALLGAAPVSRGGGSVVERDFAGTVGARQGISLRLQAEGRKVSGEYFFTSPDAYVVEAIDLKGAYLVPSELTLNEVSYDDAGKEKLSRVMTLPAGIMNAGRPSPGRITGAWYGRGQDKAEPVVLTRRPFGLPPGMRLTKKPISRRFPKLNASVDGATPQLTGALNDKATGFNRAVVSLVRRMVASFETISSSYAKDDLRVDPATGKPAARPAYGDSLNFEVVSMTTSMISVKLSAYEYYGGAHGTTITHSINYDLAKGRLLKLADLFKPGATYLPLVSRLSAGALKRGYPEFYTGSIMIRTLHDGTAARAQNYGVWNVSPDGLMVTFQQYQVAPGVAGEIEVMIPYSLLKD